MAVAIAMLGLCLILAGLYLLLPPLALIAVGIGALRLSQTVANSTPEED